METNTIGQPGNAWAPMRALPWRVESSNSWQAMPKSAVSGAQAPTVTCDHATAMPAVGIYAAPARAALTTDRVAQLCVQGVDHKFSIRLGPTASPPV